MEQQEQESLESNTLSKYIAYQSAKVESLLRKINTAIDTAQYDTVVEANQITLQLESDQLQAHSELRRLYEGRFQELETIVMNPVEYARVIQILGNCVDITKEDGLLDRIRAVVSQQQAMIINITAAAISPMQQLSDEQYDRVIRFSQDLIEMDRIKRQIIQFIATQMHYIAPNTTALVGTRIAAQLISTTGGLSALCKIPACNLPNVGKSNKPLAGYSTRLDGYKNGHVWECDLLDNVPSDMKQKCVKLISNKVTLAARLDLVKSNIDGGEGQRFREEVVQKIDQMLTPPEHQDAKVLKAPINEPRKKRGGKRARRQKERFEATALRKAQNRMAFGVAEDEILVNDEFEGLGMLSTSTAQKSQSKRTKIQ
ncbi:hypothetical protein MP228_007161 [Amoeboaphelidium protococcarum]|nr:hypothetical protein MP228_007161 [Amoeboaphelidium protococcarum]